MAKNPNRALWREDADAAFAEAERRIKSAPNSRLEFQKLLALNRIPKSIEDYPNIGFLNLGGLPLTDIDPLSKLSGLRYLNLAGSSVGDISAIASLQNLRVLRLSYTKVKDISALATLQKLEVLSLSGMKIDGLEDLAHLAQLRRLRIDNTNVHDLSPIKNANYLSLLWFGRTKVSDLTPISSLRRLRSLSFHDTLVTDLDPVAELLELISAVEFDYKFAGMTFDRCPISDQYLRDLASTPNPQRTISVIQYVRARQGLPQITASLLEEFRSQYGDEADWPRRIGQLRQTRLGARFTPQGESLVIDTTTDESDVEAASLSLTRQLQDGLKPRARKFADAASRVGNQFGWSGLDNAATRFSEIIDRDTLDIPFCIGSAYETIVELG